MTKELGDFVGDEVVITHSEPQDKEAQERIVEIVGSQMKLYRNSFSQPDVKYPLWERIRDITGYILDAMDKLGYRKPPDRPELERKLRDLLWAAHPCPGKYCDDGELQCGCFLPTIDFLRDKPEDIEVKIPLHNAQLALQKILNSMEVNDDGYRWNKCSDS